MLLLQSFPAAKLDSVDFIEKVWERGPISDIEIQSARESLLKKSADKKPPSEK